MPQETERKFLVVSDTYKQESHRNTRIVQGYIAAGSGATVRVRLRDGRGYLTIKGRPLPGHFSRYEWEKEISENEARELLQLCTGGVIDKTRYEVEFGGFTFEVDEFYGENQGLVVAEIELESEEQQFERPHWLGDEVTHLRQYYNASLLRFPFSKW